MPGSRGATEGGGHAAMLEAQRVTLERVVSFSGVGGDGFFGPDFPPEAAPAVSRQPATQPRPRPPGIPAGILRGGLIMHRCMVCGLLRSAGC